MTDIAAPAEAPKPRINTLANKITILRILIIPVVVIGLLQGRSLWVVGLLAFSMLTDFFDGLVARRRGERTPLGAFLDPLADKLLLVAVFMTLTVVGKLPTWVFVVLFSRDLLIVMGWTIIYILTGSATVLPRALGKAATVSQMVTAFALVIGIPEPGHGILVWATVILSIASALDYVMVGERQLGAWS